MSATEDVLPALPPSRPALIIEKADSLLGAGQVDDALRLFASLSTSRPHIVAGAVAQLGARAGAAERLIAARLAVADGRFSDAIDLELPASADAAATAEFLLLRSAAFALSGRLDLGEQCIRQVASLQGLDPILTQRCDWLLTYLSAGLGVSPGTRPLYIGALARRWVDAKTARASPNVFALLDYKSPDLTRISQNIGDYIQTLAALRQLARFGGVEWQGIAPELRELIESQSSTWLPEKRDPTPAVATLAVLDRDFLQVGGTLYSDAVLWTVLNGWFYDRAFGAQMVLPVPANIEPIIVSFHLARAADLTEPLLAWLREKAPVGCRDWSTTEWLVNAGVPAFFSGCLTLTLKGPPQAATARSGHYLVDAPSPSDEEGSPAAVLVHEDPRIRAASFTVALGIAADYLRLYATAERVTTSRLHCYLPCRALGTPVTLVPRHVADRRFSGLDDATDDEIRVLAEKMETRIHEVLALILKGQDRAAVRHCWADLNAEDVAYARSLIGEPVAFRPAAPASPPRGTDRTFDNPPPVTLAISFDEQVAKFVPTMLRSVRQNTRADISLVVLTRGLSSAQVTAIVAEAGARELRHFRMDGRLAQAEVELTFKTTISTMDRLFLPELLPEVDRIVYLDIDLVVLGDIAELAAVEPSDRGVAARPINPSANLAEAVERRAKYLDAGRARMLRRWAAANTDLRTPYFNAGVLVLSLERLRQAGLASTAADLITRFGLHDQDVLNFFCGGSFAPIGVEWNVMPYRDWFDAPKLIHWAGAQKPWFRRRAVAKSEVWRRYDRLDEVEVGSSTHWKAATSYPSSWDARARMAAEWLTAPLRLLDVGCGPRMALRDCLPPGSSYVGADQKPWTDETVLIDLNAGEFPTGRYDAVTFLGVIEYLDRPGLALRAGRRCADRLIVSYCHPAPGFSRSARQKLGYVNAYSEPALTGLLESSGWRVIERRVYSDNKDGRQLLYHALRTGKPSPVSGTADGP